jgi:hypothetical protein
MQRNQEEVRGCRLYCASSAWLALRSHRNIKYSSCKYYASGNGSVINQFCCTQSFGDLHNLTIFIHRNGGEIISVNLYNIFDLLFMFIISRFFFMQTLKRIRAERELVVVVVLVLLWQTSELQNHELISF